MTKSDKTGPAPTIDPTAENDGHDHGTETIGGQPVPQYEEFQRDTAPVQGEKVLDWVRRTIDPAARKLSEVQGPRDGDSRLTFLLVKINGQREVLIAQRFAPDMTGETFELYRAVETKALLNSIDA